MPTITNETDLNTAISDSYGAPTTGVFTQSVTEATAPEVVINSNLTLQGGGFTLTGDGTDPALIVNSGTLTLESLSISNPLSATAASGAAAPAAIEDGGTVLFGSDGSSGANIGVISAAITDNGGTAGAVEVNAVAPGSAPLAVVFSAANTYTGATTVNGELALTGAGSIATSASVTLTAAAGATAGATVAGTGLLNISGATGVAGGAGGVPSVSVQNFSGNAGSEVVLGGDTLLVNNNVGGATAGAFAGTLVNSASGAAVTGAAGGLTLQSGELDLSGVSTYTGQTTVNAYLVLENGASIATSDDLSLQASGADVNFSALTATGGGATTVVLNELTGIANTAVMLGANSLEVKEAIITAFFKGGISGSGGLQLDASANKFSLGGANTYTGSTNILGDLAIIGAGSIADSSNVSLHGSTAVFDISGATATVAINELTGVAGSSVVLGNNTLSVDENLINASFSGAISGNGGLTLVATGTGPHEGDILTLNGLNTYMGETTLKAGTTLSLGANGSIASSSGVQINATATLNLLGAETSTGGVVTETLTDLTGAGTVNLGSNSLILAGGSVSKPAAFTGNITGSGNVTVSGDVSLGGTDAYTGQTIVNGDLTLTGANTIAASSNVSLQQTGATLTIASEARVAGNAGVDGTTIHELTGIAGTSVVIGDDELRVIENVADASFSGVISGGGTLSLFGPDSLTLKGLNTYTGDTEIHGTGAQGAGTAATLVLGAGGSIAQSDVVIVDGTFNVAAVTGGTAMIQALEGDSAGSVVLGSSTLVVTGGEDDEFSGVISGSGGLQIGQVGSSSAEQFLVGANTYTGQTILYGTLYLDNAEAVADSSNVSLKGAGAELFVDTSTTINELTGIAGTTVYLEDGQTLTINENVVNASFSGSFAGYGAVVLNGPDTLTLNGASNTFGEDGSSVFEVNAGATLAVGASGSLSTFAGVYVEGVLDLSAGSGRAISVEYLTDQSFLSDSTGASTGQIKLGSNSLVITEENASGSFDDAFGGVISGAGGLTLSSGSLLLSGDNTYTGSTTVAASGNLILDGSTMTSNIVDNGELQVVTTGTFAPAISGTGFVVFDAADFGPTGTAAVTTLTALETYTGVTDVDDGTTLAIGAGGSIAASAYVDLFSEVNNATSTLDISAAGATVAVGGLVGQGAVVLGANTLEITGVPGENFSGSITGSGGLQIDANGALTLTQASSSSVYVYTGATNVLGTLTLDGVTLDSSNVSIRSGGSLVVENAVVINELTGQTKTTVMLDGAASSLSVTENVVAASYSGVISGAGSFDLSGPDALTLLGVNTYTGTTTIETGASLVIQGSGQLATTSMVTDNGTLRFAIGATAATLDNVHGTGTLSLGQAMLTDTLTGTGTTATLSGLIQGVGSLTVAGVTAAGTTGTTPTPASHLTLSGANTFTGGLNITGGVVELASSGAASSNTIHFADNGANVGVLQIDNAALTGLGTGMEHFANTITGLSAVGTTTGGDVIDLTGLTYEGAATATYSGTTLTVTEGNASVSLTLTGVPAGDTFAAYQDSHGGTFLVLEGGTPTSMATYDMTHFHP